MVNKIITINTGKHARTEDLPVYQYKFTDMPMDIIHVILLNLNMEDISNCRLLSKNMSQITSHVDLWQLLYRRDFKMAPPKEDFSKKTYEDLYAYRSNLANGVYASDFRISQATEPLNNKFDPMNEFCPIPTKIAIADGKLFLYSDDNRIPKYRYSLEAWDLKTLEPLGVVATFPTDSFNQLVGAEDKLFGLSDSVLDKK